jgi:hypothetical protein
LAGADGHLQEKRNCGKGEMNFLSGILLEQWLWSSFNLIDDLGFN